MILEQIILMGKIKIKKLMNILYNCKIRQINNKYLISILMYIKRLIMMINLGFKK